MNLEISPEPSADERAAIAAGVRRVLGIGRSLDEPRNPWLAAALRENTDSGDAPADDPDGLRPSTTSSAGARPRRR